MQVPPQHCTVEVKVKHHVTGNLARVDVRVVNQNYRSLQQVSCFSSAVVKKKLFDNYVV